MCICGAAQFTSVTGEDQGGAPDEWLPYEAWRCVRCGAVMDQPEERRLLADALQADECGRGATVAELAAVVAEAEMLALRVADLEETLATGRVSAARFRKRVKTAMQRVANIGERSANRTPSVRLRRQMGRAF